MKVYAESPELMIPISFESTEVIETGKWGFQKPYTTSMIAPCEEACPAGIPIATFIYLAGEGKFREALETILKENPFPGVCGRVCFHPCESVCNRNQYDEAVSVNPLERYVFDTTMDLSPKLNPAPNTDPKEIAIVGAGPAGLSCAYFLALLGHKVTLFEARKEPGGVLRWGIPEFRLPKQVLKKEIQRILGLGIELKTGVRVGKDLSIEALSQFDAVFLSPGASRGILLGIEDENLIKIWRGIDFLNRINSGEQVRPGKVVVVIGGGNTAMDVARSARRLGSSVTVAYRRTKKEMPAISDEIEEADQEGVRFEFLIQPVKIKLLKNRKIRIKFQRMRLRKSSQEKRPRPIPIKGSFVMMEADRLITAVGEGVDLSWIPQALIEKEFLKPMSSLWNGKTKVFAGGDAIEQHRSVVTAISSGKRAAISIDLSFTEMNPEEVFSNIRVGSKGALSMEAYLRGRQTGIWEEPKGVVFYDQINTLFFAPSERVKKRRIDPGKSLRGFSEVHSGLLPEEAEHSALRCFSCGTCNYCYNCYFFCPEGAVTLDPVNQIRTVDFQHCKGCGTCAKACPRNVVEMRREE